MHRGFLRVVCVIAATVGASAGVLVYEALTEMASAAPPPVVNTDYANYPFAGSVAGRVHGRQRWPRRAGRLPVVHRSCRRGAGPHRRQPHVLRRSRPGAAAVSLRRFQATILPGDRVVARWTAWAAGCDSLAISFPLKATNAAVFDITDDRALLLDRPAPPVLLTARAPNVPGGGRWLRARPCHPAAEGGVRVPAGPRDRRPAGDGRAERLLHDQNTVRSQAVPAPSAYPIIGSTALLFMGFGAAFTVNKMPLGYGLLAIGFAILIYMLFGWFGTVARESESGKFNKQVGDSFRWGMSWFIFSEVMFFAAFFGALFYMRVYSIPWLADLEHKILWPNFTGSWPTAGPGDHRKIHANGAVGSSGNQYSHTADIRCDSYLGTLGAQAE